MPDGAGRRYLAALLIVLAGAALLRGVWLTADPPTRPPEGIVWHDEGAWVHNARNRVLWGAWRVDNWNPVFINPVFTALEYVAFRAFGVGTWQARTVPAASGLFAIACLAGGLAAAGGRRAALVGAILLATNYVFVMWNRAALMESTMTAFIVAAWAAYAAAERRPVMGLLAGVAAVLAWFTKAAAAFFVAAIIADCGGTLVLAGPRGFAKGSACRNHPRRRPRGVWTLVGLAAAGHWPSRSSSPLLVRIPLLQLADVGGAQAGVHAPGAGRPCFVAARCPRLFHPDVAGDRGGCDRTCGDCRGLADRAALRATARLVGFVGFVELIVHDSGNERRYVMFIPAFIALAALVIGRTGPLVPATAARDRGARWMSAPVVLFLLYLVFGSLVRLAFLGEMGPPARLSAALAFAAGALVISGGGSRCASGSLDSGSPWGPRSC